MVAGKVVVLSSLAVLARFVLLAGVVKGVLFGGARACEFGLVVMAGTKMRYVSPRRG